MKQYIMHCMYFSILAHMSMCYTMEPNPSPEDTDSERIAAAKEDYSHAQHLFEQQNKVLKEERDTQVKTLKKQIKQLKQEKRNLETQHAKANNELQSKCNDLNQIKHMNTDTITELETQIKQTKQQLSETQQTLATTNIEALASHQMRVNLSKPWPLKDITQAHDVVDVKYGYSPPPFVSVFGTIVGGLGGGLSAVGLLALCNITTYNRYTLSAIGASIVAGGYAGNTCAHHLYRQACPQWKENMHIRMEAVNVEKTAYTPHFYTKSE